MFVLYQKHLNPYWMRSRGAIKGRFDTLLQGVDLKSHNVALLTVFLPFLRCIICAVTVTTLGHQQTLVLIFVFTTLMYLTFLICNRTKEDGNYDYITIFEQVIILLLSYLMIMLSDFVLNELAYNTIS
jgi:hypothetical protein